MITNASSPRAARPAAPSGRTRYGTGASGSVRRALGGELVAGLEKLCGPADSGYRDVCQDLAAIVVAALAGMLVGHVIGPLLAVGYIGVRQRHLSNLAHESVHSKLVATRWGNRAIGHLLTGLLGGGFVPYRSSHAVHHARLGSPDDPMLQSYLAGNLRTPRPSGRAAFVVRVLIGNAIWRLPKDAVLALITTAPPETWRAPAARVAVWSALLAACVPIHAAGLVLVYWLIPLIFVRPVVTWITDLGNHAGLIENTDPLLQTRGWSSHWLTRHLLGGHLDDMYHPIHHWCPLIPWRRLPEAAELVSGQLDRWQDVPWCSGFFFRRRATPDRPCVIEDIIARLAVPAVQTGPSTSV